MDRLFFTVCDKCGHKIYKHSGVEEPSPGFFDFHVICKNCNFDFYHKMQTAEFRNTMKEMQQEQTGKMIKATGLGALIGNLNKKFKEEEE